MAPRHTITVSPHIGTAKSTKEIMWGVVYALVPSLLCSIYFFGDRAVAIIAVAVASSVITEHLIQRFCKMHGSITDGAAVVTGILIAFNLPPGVPLWIPALASAFGIGIAKMAFGGLGYNIFNPALAGRIFAMFSWLPFMTRWQPPQNTILGSEGTKQLIGAFYSSNVDAVTYATPLGILKEGYEIAMPSYWDLFAGNCGGCIGETSALAILLGGIYMLYKQYITWETPVFYIGTVALLTWVFGQEGLLTGDGLFHVLTGGLFLGAFFMATDMVTSPISRSGRMIFAIGCGLFTVLIRFKGGFPEGVSYSIFFMNALTPLIDRMTEKRRAIYGSKA